MILIIDDDPSVVASLGLLLKQHGYRFRSASTPDEALALIRSERFDLVLQDMNYSRSTTGEEGLALLEKIRDLQPRLPVVLITAWGTISLAVEGMKRGASDFITKPWSNAQILQSIDTAVRLREAEQESAGSSPLTRAEIDNRFDFRAIIGQDKNLLRVLELIGRVAPTDASVLITGESGTGKELVAEAIHRNSRRRNAPFVKVNLGGISSTLFESEMFGHVRGAFTDARENRRGRFEVADGGTIFLDEIGEIDLNSQVKLLRVLQDRTYEILGSSRSRTVNIRIVSATNRPLPELVQQNKFREDLLYRLNLITIDLPALRDRRDDIPVLAKHFLEICSGMYSRGSVTLTPGAIEWLRAQPWPGNIRQLRQVIERAVLIGEGDRLDVKDFRASTELETRATAANALPDAGSMTLDELEKAMIEKCLRHYGGNVSRVAEALGLTRASLYRRLEKYGLSPASVSQ